MDVVGRSPCLYLASPPSLPTCVVERSQDPELVHGVEHVVFRGRVHEVEEQQILDTQRLEQQYHVGQIGPLDLWDGGHQHLIFIGTLGVQPELRQIVESRAF